MNELLKKYNDYNRLVGCTAEYELDDGTIIEIQYFENGFAHLIGLHKLKDLQIIQFWQNPKIKSVNTKELARRIRKGVLTDDIIRSSKFFSLIQDRYENFSYDNLTTLNYTDAIINFDPSLVGSKIKSNYILFEEKPSGEYNHMGIVFLPNIGNKYIETFFHEPTDSYISGQKIVKVKAFRLKDSDDNIIVEDKFYRGV